MDAGIAILEGTKIGVSAIELTKIAEANLKQNSKSRQGKTLFFKGLELAGLHGIHFRQSSVNGMIIATRSKQQIKATNCTIDDFKEEKFKTLLRICQCSMVFY